MSDILLGSDTYQSLRNGLRNSRLLVINVADVHASDWVTESATALLRKLRLDAATNKLAEQRTIVLATFPHPHSGDEAAYRAAAVQSLRGIVQSVTREYAHRARPLNLVVIENDAPQDAASTVRFLDADQGSYTAGSTIDLTTKAGAHS